MIYVIIVLAILIFDQVSKYLILNNISIDTSQSVINNFLYFTHIKNSGTAFGFFQNGNLFMIPMISIISVIVCYFMFKQKNRFLKLSLSVVLGGALGNLIDRIFRGSVVDFIDFRFGNYHFYIFNIADMFICIGTALLAFYLLFLYKEKDETMPKADNEQEH